MTVSTDLLTVVFFTNMKNFKQLKALDFRKRKASYLKVWKHENMRHVFLKGFERVINRNMERQGN